MGALALFSGSAHAGYAAMVVDATTGQVVSAVNPDEQNYPASLTKMMTLYLAFQALHSGRLQMQTALPVSSWAANKAPTKLGLRPGQTISVHDCILGMITKSANDAATVMAEGLGGTESGFAGMMNAQAQKLGMTHTHFANASGLPDPNNLSSARDLMLLSRALYRDFPDQAPLFATKEFMFRGQLVRGHNHLMDRYPGMDGLKTGFTGASGFNLASTAVRNGHRLFGVVMGGRSAAVRDQLMARLLDDGFDHRVTPDAVVAAASMAPLRPMRGRGERVARRMLAALSPIQIAQAEALPSRRAMRARRAHARAHARTAQLAQVRAHKPLKAAARKKARVTRLARATPKTVRHRHSKQRVMLASRRGN
ncbi:D-alanyl-D-alanine carboxypeptidase family protein [Frateuria aurantia]